MLRLSVLLLLLANVVYFVYEQGMLVDWGLAPVQQSEPQRLQQQIRPDAIRVLSTDETRRLELSVGPGPADCLQAGLFTDAEAQALKKAFASWPEGSWGIDPGVEPARWIVYMGKYPTADNLNRKKSELRQLGISFEAVANPALDPGLALGGYPSETAAKQQLEALAQKGVRTAKVVLERPEARGLLLKIPAVDDTLRPRLDDLKTALNGKALRACR